MFSKSRDEQISQALSDMPRWRRKMARKFLWYAILMLGMLILFLVETWLFRHKIAHLFSVKPLMGLKMVGVNIFAACSIIGTIGILLKKRREMLEHDARMAQMHALRNTTEAAGAAGSVGPGNGTHT